MITVTDLSLNYSGTPLFSHVDLQFLRGNCYGIIGANGAGKSTFLKILSGQLEPSTGEVSILPNVRMSVLKQDQNTYDAYNVMDTVIMGNQRLYDIGKQKEALYAKEEMSDEDGMLACQLEEEYAELGGWEAESDASRILQGLGLGTELHYNDMATLDARLKVKVLLAQALFGNPDLLMMDEPTNNLDIDAVNWLEEFLLDFEGTVIVVSHDRHFLNTVCTHIVDIDYNKIKMYVGNYDFWYESSQLVQQLIKNQNKRNEEKIKELQDFISRFSANKSKSKQATARRKLLDKLTVEEMPASSRRYPWVGFTPDREVGKDILFVTDVSKTIDGRHRILCRGQGLCGQTHRRLCDIKARQLHPAALFGKGLCDAPVVPALAAARIQQMQRRFRRGRQAVFQTQLSQRPAEDAVVSGIQKRAAGRHHLFAVAGGLGAHALHRQQVPVAFLCTVEAVALCAFQGAVAGQFLPAQRALPWGKRFIFAHTSSL